MAILFQAALLGRHAPALLADLFARARIAQQTGCSFGAITSPVDVRRILARQTPLWHVTGFSCSIIIGSRAVRHERGHFIQFPRLSQKGQMATIGS